MCPTLCSSSNAVAWFAIHFIHSMQCIDCCIAFLVSACDFFFRSFFFFVSFFPRNCDCHQFFYYYILVSFLCCYTNWCCCWFFCHWFLFRLIERRFKTCIFLCMFLLSLFYLQIINNLCNRIDRKMRTKYINAKKGKSNAYETNTKGGVYFLSIYPRTFAIYPSLSLWIRISTSYLNNIDIGNIISMPFFKQLCYRTFHTQFYV